MEEGLKTAESDQNKSSITRGDVIKARDETEDAYSTLMDEMVKSIETQGDWFIPLGGKVKHKDRDSRVMLLRAVDQSPATNEESNEIPVNSYTFVTREGILTFESSPDYRKTADSLDSILKGEIGLTFSLNEKGGIQEDSYSGSDAIYISSGMLKPLEGGQESFAKKVKRSIEMSSEPEWVKNKKEMESIKDKGGIAKNATNMISSLPPKF